MLYSFILKLAHKKLDKVMNFYVNYKINYTIEIIQKIKKN
jgi:hypothetical protein